MPIFKFTARKSVNEGVNVDVEGEYLEVVVGVAVKNGVPVIRFLGGAFAGSFLHALCGAQPGVVVVVLGISKLVIELVHAGDRRVGAEDVGDHADDGFGDFANGAKN